MTYLRMGLRSRRLREKYCLILIFMSFLFICVAMIFFLPDLRAKTSAGVQDVYQKLPELFLAPGPPIPAPVKLDTAKDKGTVYGIPRPLESPRNAEDKRRLYAKIMEEEEEQRRVLEKPKLINDRRTSSTSTSKKTVGANVLPPMGGILSPSVPVLSKGLVQTNVSSEIVIRGGEDSSVDVRQKRDFIKEVYRHISADSYTAKPAQHFLVQISMKNSPVIYI